jgi:hypothetical protein
LARRRYRSDERLPLGTTPPAPPPPAPTPDPKPEPAGPQYDASGLKAQIDAMRAQQQPADQLDRYIAHFFQGALPNERQWLRDRAHDRPHYFANPMLVHQAGMLALQDGVVRESPEFLHAIGKKLDDHFAAMRAAPAPPPAAPMPPPMPPSLPEPQHVARVDVEHVEHDHEPPQEDHIMPEHVSAPVSRSGGERYAMGDYEPTIGTIRLSKAEREHAAAAGVSDEVYAANKLKMMKLKKAKVIRDE